MGEAGPTRATTILTPTELRVLRLFWDQRATNDQIAAALTISTETVKTHFRNIRRKTGLTKLQAAQMLFVELPTPSGGTPEMGSDHTADLKQSSGAVREERVAFDHAGTDRLLEGDRRDDRDQLSQSHLRTLALIAAIAAALAVVLLALEPLANSGQHLANWIQPDRIYRPGH